MDTLLNLNPKTRVDIELRNRINSGWAKFHEHRAWLCNHHIPVGLRLRLFDAVVTPAILFGGAVLPLNKKGLEHIDGIQRKMLRLIVGWRRIANEDWEVTMRRMKERVSNALHHFQVQLWSHRF